MQKSYTEEEMAQYRSKHHDDMLKTQDSNGNLGTWGGAKNYFLEYSKERVLRLDTFIKTLKIKTVLDFGCGKGTAADTIADTVPNLLVSKYDPVFEEFSQYPQGSYDLVLCFLVIHLATPQNQQLIAQQLTALSSKYVVLTALAGPRTLDNYYPNLFPDFKVKVFKRWRANLPIPSHRGNDCVTLVLEKLN